MDVLHLKHSANDLADAKSVAFKTKNGFQTKPVDIFCHPD